jgi:hypothetical protein
VVAISVQYGVPCAHTQMCAFETTKRREDKLEKAKASGGKVHVESHGNPC